MDCADDSDEIECFLVSIPPGYTTELAPPPIGNENVLFQFNLVITSIRKFDLTGFRISIDVISTIKWIDHRVNFNGLRSSPDINIIKIMDRIWLPNLYIEDAAQSPSDLSIITNDLTVIKQTDELPKDLSSLKEGNKIDLLDV